jgi:hypothetical protein
MELFTELRDNPADINAIVARRRKDFTGEFFRHLNFLVNAYNGLDERDGNYPASVFLFNHMSHFTLYYFIHIKVINF